MGASGVAWPSLLARLRDLVDLEGSARDCGALRRRREVADAGVLLRLALVYGGTKLSLRGTVAWVAAAGVADLSDVALLYRLQGAESWLGWLVRELLSRSWGRSGPGWRCRAAGVCGWSTAPGSASPAPAARPRSACTPRSTSRPDASTRSSSPPAARRRASPGSPPGRARCWWPTGCTSRPRASTRWWRKAAMSWCAAG